MALNLLACFKPEEAVCPLCKKHITDGQGAMLTLHLLKVRVAEKDDEDAGYEKGDVLLYWDDFDGNQALGHDNCPGYNKLEG